MVLWVALSLALQVALVEHSRRRLARVRSAASVGDAAVRALQSRGNSDAPLEVVELVREVRAARDAAAVRAWVNVQLVDVAEALEGTSVPFTAAARAGLFAGTGLALLALAFHVRQGTSDVLAYVFDVAPFAVGFAGFATIRWLGQRAEDAARQGRERWNRFARMAMAQGAAAPVVPE